MNMLIDSDMTVELVGMEFHSYHGCLESERKEGNTFMVDFRGKASLKKAAKSDDLNDAQDYAEVYKIIAAEMEKPSNLLENAINRSSLGFWFVQVRVSKKNPPVGGLCSWARVTATSGANLDTESYNETF